MTDQSSGDELERLAALAREAAQRPLEEGQARVQRAAFMARVDGALLEPSRNRWRLWWTVPALAAAAALVLLSWRLSPGELTFDVRGAVRDGEYVRATGDRAATLTFSDQTTVLAAPGSRLRVEDTTERGARVLVERGRADVHVVHRAASAWTFIAGSFSVTVTGTRFTLDWDPAHERLALALQEGSVEVRGAAGAGPWVVRAGQRFLGDLERASMQVSGLDEAPATQPTKSDQSAPPAPIQSASPPAGAALAPAEPTGSAPRSATATAKGDSWEQRIVRGEFADIVKEAEARGTGACLATCSASDLRALSDAARYTGKADLAVQSLLALRKRFGSSAGKDAAFLLGRLEEWRGSGAAALSWYDTYLREAPGGAFAAEALAGKMRAVRATSGARAATPLARDYLERFPKGVHVDTARQILDGK